MVSLCCHFIRKRQCGLQNKDKKNKNLLQRLYINRRINLYILTVLTPPEFLKPHQKQPNYKPQSSVKNSLCFPFPDLIILTTDT